ncbi:MAG: 30S ribosomal protein S21 [Candidatus Omnitrophica bacterium]|nr:30S ribosomal protein S21 [Candidatus Omnitrophota bacterium]
MAKIVLKPGQSIEGALMAFRRQCQQEGIIQNFKKAARYEKPSAARRIKQKESRRRNRVKPAP